MNDWSLLTCPFSALPCGELILPALVAAASEASMWKPDYHVDGVLACGRGREQNPGPSFSFLSHGRSVA
jgi:hypothetical protein